MTDSVLKKLRAAKSLSKKELSEKSGVNAVTIWEIETGRSQGSLPTLKKLAAALGVGPEIFFAADVNFTCHAIYTEEAV